MSPKFVLTLLIALFIFIAPNCIFGLEMIDAGNVGIKINKAGTETKRGVEDVPTVSGWVPYWRLTQNVLEYPVTEQPVEWTGDRKFSFASKEGMRFASGMSARYILSGASVPDFYRDYKVTDMKVFEERYLYPEISNALLATARDYEAQGLVGAESQKFLTATRERLEDRLKEMHVGIRHLGFIGNMDLPAGLLAAIQAKLAKQQEAATMDADKTLAERTALRDKAIAEGKAAVEWATTESRNKQTRATADANAYATIERAKADAEAMRLIAKQGNDGIELKKLEVQLAIAQNWKGDMPSTVIGDIKGSGMVMQLPAIK